MSSTSDIAQKYRELNRECQELAQKIAELDTDRNEHKLVEETLEPLDPERRAFRLVGGVLVERSVAEVLPSIKGNRENLEKVLSTFQDRLKMKQKGLVEFKAKHNIQDQPAQSQQ
uniref:Prefoldin subunit 2 n=1 Tax=Grammatophora oceanica TaxID=210454 RepID=A0A7S1YK49_9STRA|mmetsp:Transcript_51076/g.76305  ORF Transcript_51076/g.76305 Transcript_51076/m.76305 type:complete len:115 (+) Transcript_51076:75-419(+)